MIFVFKKCTPTRIIFEMYKQISSKNSESPCKETQLINSIFAGLIWCIYQTESNMCFVYIVLHLDGILKMDFLVPFTDDALKSPNCQLHVVILL